MKRVSKGGVSCASQRHYEHGLTGTRSADRLCDTHLGADVELQQSPQLASELLLAASRVQLSTVLLLLPLLLTAPLSFVFVAQPLHAVRATGLDASHTLGLGKQHIAAGSARQRQADWSVQQRCHNSAQERERSGPGFRVLATTTQCLVVCSRGTHHTRL
jgi:hypothetical protein